MKPLLLCLMAAALAAPASAAVERYRIDPTHTYPMFAVDHLGFSIQRGRFDRTSGELELDPDARTGKVTIRIEVASLSSGDDKRDQRLKGESFFDAQNHPTIDFVSTAVDWTGDYPSAVTGDLTVRGVTRPVTLRISRFKCGFHLFNLGRACGAEASLTLRRSEFGMDSWLSSIGNDVEITIQMEAIRQ